MKRCPVCKSIFPPDNDFCLIDGSALVPDARQPEPFNVSNIPTQVIYQTPQTQPANISNSSKWLYLALGGGGAIVIAAALFIVWSANTGSATEKFTSAGKRPDDPKSTAAVTTTPSGDALAKITPPAASVSPAGRWTGDWSSPSGAYLTIVVDLNDDGTGKVSGQINWTLRRTARRDKMSKIGMSATEYVNGQFHPGTRTVTMKGYRKDDPNDVLVMLDDYRLVLSADDRHLDGSAKNGGKWNATIKLAR